MMAYIRAERYEDAISTFEDLDYETLNAQLLLVASYAHAGRQEEARTAAARVLESHPDFRVSGRLALSIRKPRKSICAMACARLVCLSELV